MMRIIFTLFITISLTTVFAQKEELEKEQLPLKGLDEKEIKNIIQEANKVYNVSSVETELVSPQKVDLATELQNLKDFKDLKEKLEKLEKARKGKFSQDIEAYKLKYKTALTIIDDIILDAKKLEVQYKTLQIYSDYSKNANPTEYEAYEQNLNILRDDRFKSNIELPDLDISNPYISIAYSMIGGIFSKNKQKSEVIKNMTCITDFTMEFKSDLKSIDNQITYLSASTTNLSMKGQAIFIKLGRAINYSESYDNYRKDIKINGIEDPLKSFRQTYFDNIKSKESELNSDIGNSNDIKSMELNFMLVIDYIKSYEILLFQGLSYYNSFIAVAKKYGEPNDKYACIGQDEITKKFKHMIIKLEETRDLYSDAYISVVSTSDKLKFYFGTQIR